MILNFVPSEFYPNSSMDLGFEEDWNVCVKANFFFVNFYDMEKMVNFPPPPSEKM